MRGHFSRGLANKKNHIGIPASTMPVPSKSWGCPQQWVIFSPIPPSGTIVAMIPRINLVDIESPPIVKDQASRYACNRARLLLQYVFIFSAVSASASLPC